MQSGEDFGMLDINEILAADSAPPQRITRMHSPVTNDATAACILTDAVAATHLYRASTHHAPEHPQILHTPRRVLEQTQARAIGMAIMDFVWPSTREVAQAGNLMSRFQEVAVEEAVRRQRLVKPATPQGAVGVLESPHSAEKTRIPVPTIAIPPPRVLLPNPFEVLGIPQPVKVEQVVKDVAELGASPLLLDKVSEIGALDYKWMKVSPRRVAEGQVDASGDYRGGIRPSIVITASDRSRTEDELVTSPLEDLGKLEARFKDIAGQLLNRTTSATVSTVAKAAESEEGPVVEVVLRGLQIPDMFAWEPHVNFDEKTASRPNTSVFAGAH
ncbi:hypothetical protein BC830DRAFT_1228275 [Chytriomyces sp. MP71]|nr:hypothetical protein BC830DRAFT_1228275 [Chytriomyces sp. MP71]